MKQIVLAAAVMSMAAVLGTAGCKSQPKPVEPTVPTVTPTTQQVAAIREQYLREFPNARVGVVSTVLDDQPFLTVEEIDTKDLKAGDWFTILDGTETIIGYGRVVTVMNESRLAVQFDEKVRRPMVGDVAVKF